MKFPWKWLSELVDLNNIKPKQAIESLTLAGFEVENNYLETFNGIEHRILDVSIMANRHDVSSMIGMARELSIILNTKLINQFNYKNKKEIKHSEEIQHSKIIANPNISNVLCNLKISTIKLIEKNPSPLWLTNYLTICDIQPTNILHDICAYINLKWGQDIEIFDIGKINTHKANHALIRLDTVAEQQKIYKLLKTDQNLENLAILKYDEDILSILGITSNTNFYCNENSCNLLITGQICHSGYIRKQILRIKQKTEKINKHLKYIINEDLQSAYDEAIHLILSLNKGYLIAHYNYSKNKINQEKSVIYVDHKTINNILGPYNKTQNNILTETDISNTLEQLKFKCSYRNNIFQVEVPEHRKDLIRPIDVVEEIAKICGFNKFIDTLPINNKIGSIPEISKTIRKIRYTLRNLGLHEIIHSSLEKQYTDNQNIIRIYNPLMEDQSQLKKSLIKQIVYTSKYNKKQKNLPLECFEIGKVFYNSTNNNKSYTEQIHLAGILGNPSFSRKNWAEKNEELTWFQAKGLIEEFFEKVSTKIDWINPENYRNSKIYKSCYHICHPHRTAILCDLQTKQEIGIFSQLSSTTNIEIHKTYNNYIFEINLLNLMNSRKVNNHLNYNLEAYSIYPSVTRDISLILSKVESAYLIKKKILKEMQPLVESVEIFDEYNKNHGIDKNRHVGFRITYRSNIRTLKNTDIKEIDEKIHVFLKNQFESKS